MSLRKYLNSSLLACYGKVARFIGPHNPQARHFYRAVYFAYKRLLEDDLHLLLDSYPTILSGGHTLDVGANIGYTATLLSKHCDRNRNVIAFEPERANFETLLGTIKKYSLTNIEPHRLAIGKDRGSVTLAINKLHPGDHRISHNKDVEQDEFQSVEMIAIDQFIAQNLRGEPIAFVKIDVQGYELSVCQGMTELVQNNPNIKIFLEFSPGDLKRAGTDPLDLILWLEKRDFIAHRVGQTGLVQPVQLSELCDEMGYMNILLSRQQLSTMGKSQPSRT